MVLGMFIAGCEEKIKPIQVTKTHFDIKTAEEILKRAWKPVHSMTNSELHITKPNMPISSEEEFFERYKFPYMNNWIKHDIYHHLIDKGKSGELLKDKKGNLIFGERNFIPTIFDEGSVIKDAYIKESIYKEEDLNFNNVELIIEEDNEKIQYDRRNHFIKNENNEWVLSDFEGTVVIQK